jgi:hypothetical protein
MRMKIAKDLVSVEIIGQISASQEKVLAVRRQAAACG